MCEFIDRPLTAHEAIPGLPTNPGVTRAFLITNPQCCLCTSRTVTPTATLCHTQYAAGYKLHTYLPCRHLSCQPAHLASQQVTALPAGLLGLCQSSSRQLLPAGAGTLLSSTVSRSQQCNSALMAVAAAGVHARCSKVSAAECCKAVVPLCSIKSSAVGQLGGSGWFTQPPRPRL